MKKLVVGVVSVALLSVAGLASAAIFQYNITASNNGDSNGPPVGQPVTVLLAPSTNTDCSSVPAACTVVATVPTNYMNYNFVATYDNQSDPTKGTVSVWVGEPTGYYRCTYNAYPAPNQITISAHMGGCLGQS